MGRTRRFIKRAPRLRERLTAAETERAQAQAELSTLTDAAQVLQEDREALRNKIAELQAAVELLQPGSEYLQALLPDHWARANPASVSHERRKEREAVAENKQIRFLRRQLAQVAGRQSQPQASEQAQAS